VNERGRFRSALEADLAALFECDEEVAGDRVTRQAQIALAVDRGYCSVWAESDRILGFAVTLPSHFFGRDFVELLVVSGRARRKGVGRSLLREVARTPGPEIWISTNESNLAMRALLASEGWVFSGTLAGLDDGDPEMFFYLPRRVDFQRVMI
jgi:GNAT superfamily N-acetyltransferase